MKRLLFIGLDALDSVQIEKFADFLPNISRLRRQGFYAQFDSVWPPDSETAWSSIYTGWNPARHGILEFVDPLEKVDSYVRRERDSSIFHGHTFWDLVGSAGRRVCVLFPHICFPAWPVNGLMVTRASLDESVSVSPQKALDNYNFNDLNTIKGPAGRNRKEYLDSYRKLVKRQLALNLEVLKKESWDLFFSYWSALDVIQHQFWAHCDPSDPTYPGENEFQHAIRDFYILHDEVVGKLIEQIDSETAVIVMSDHGHGMRPVKLFNINRLLLENGYLNLKAGNGHTKANINKFLKDSVMSFVSCYGLGELAANILKMAPWIKKFYVSASNLDLDNSIAHITDMSGIKAYSYGGIRINKNKISGQDYEAVRKDIMEIVMNARDPQLGEEPLVSWIKPCEEVYQGPHIYTYPDLIFSLRLDYGAGWDATGPLFDTTQTHNLFPGSHIQSNAVFMMMGPGVDRISRSPSSMMDIAPTVLDILNIAVPDNLDGSSILY
jgi:predicted AlkP superfamily phosphohydrolase/phosphomutase